MASRSARSITADPYYLPRGYYYSPSICIEAGVLHGYLFCRPAYGHYYFGDYYDPAYVRFGFSPCFGVDVRFGYEPFYVHDRWYYRHDPMWDRRMHEDYEYRRDHVEARPPHTYALAVRWDGGGHGVRVTFGTPVSHMAAGGHGNMHFEHVSQERRQQMVHEQREARQAQAERGRSGGKGPQRRPWRDADQSGAAFGRAAIQARRDATQARRDATQGARCPACRPGPRPPVAIDGPPARVVQQQRQR